MIEDLKKVLDNFKVDFGEMKQRLIEIGKKKYVDSLNSKEIPPIHYNHCYFTMASFLLKDVRHILEIGTGPGRSTTVFAKLFPEAIIHTVDVPSSDPYFLKSWAGRNAGQYRKEIAMNLNYKNIDRITENSFFLPSLGLPKQFEIILVDGSHVYPAVAWDIMFAYNSLASGGFLFMHDYEVERKTENDVKLVVEYMRKRVEEEIWLFPEYADPKWENGKMACLRGK